MLSQAENQAARRAAEDFQTEATAYQALLQSHSLPLSVNLDQLTSIYRGRLFEQLLTADNGLKARYDLARTKEGKQRIQADTMAGISLQGHELPEQLAEALADLERAHHALPHFNDVPRLPLATLASSYSLDYGRLLDVHTMQWEGKEHARAYFEQLAATFTQWRNLTQAGGGATGNLTDLFDYVTRPFHHQLLSGQPISLDEKKLYQYLQHNPQLLDLLAGPPVSRAAA